MELNNILSTRRDIVRLLEAGAHYHIKSGLRGGGPLHKLITLCPGELAKRFRVKAAEVMLDYGVDANLTDFYGKVRALEIQSLNSIRSRSRSESIRSEFFDRLFDRFQLSLTFPLTSSLISLSLICLSYLTTIPLDGLDVGVLRRLSGTG